MSIDQASQATKDFIRDALIWDNTLPWGPSDANDETWPRFHQVGFDVLSLTVMAPDATLDSTIRQIARVRAAIQAQPERFALCGMADDILAAKAAGKLALVFNLQETNMLEGKLEMVQAYYDLGVRQMSLVHDERNHVGDGCAERTDGGLSRWGLEVVAEMNRVGMLIDGTHAGYRTTMDAMAASTAPFVFSHSGAYAVHPHRQNIRDDQIRACAATGGIMGLNGRVEFLDDASVAMTSLFRHLDHIVQMVGAKHVGLGLDYRRSAARFLILRNNDAPVPPDKPGGPGDLTSPEQVEELTHMMLGAGYPEAAVRGILGDNWMRLARQGWA